MKVVGAYHAELARYIEEKYNLKSYAVRNVSVRELKQIILDNNFFIASVTPEIRYAPQKSLRKSGHLVLVFGVLERGGVTKFIFHNSTGFLAIIRNVVWNCTPIYFRNIFLVAGLL